MVKRVSSCLSVTLRARYDLALPSPRFRSHSCVGVTVIRKLIHTAQSKHYTAFVFDSLHVSLKKIKPSTQPLARPPRPVNNSTK